MKRLTTGDHELWELAMANAPVGMALLTPEGRYLRVNPAFSAIVGYTEEELRELSFADLTHPEDMAEGVRAADDMVAGVSGAHSLRKRYVRRDGTIVPVDLSTILQRNPDGTPRLFITHVVDRSEASEAVERAGLAERQVVNEQLRTRAILDTDVVGVTLIDLDGRFQAVNAMQQSFFDLAFPGGHSGRVGRRGHIYDADQTRLLAPHEIPSTRAALGEEFDNFLCWAGPDPDTRRALVISARNVPDSDGKRSGSAMVFNDVTEMMRAVRARGEFVSSISHELRTPLTSALAHLEMLDADEDLGHDQHRHVEVALRNVVRLSHMVADILFASRAAAGATLFERYDADVAQVGREAIDAVRARARSAGIRIVAVLPDSVVIHADGLRIRQVFDNIIDNALVHTSGGTVTVRLEDQGEVLVLSVTDTGEGLEPAELVEVFDWFFRGRSALERQIPGAGLGLTTVRTIVEAHGGTVQMHSTPGVGSAVTVVLPR